MCIKFEINLYDGARCELPLAVRDAIQVQIEVTKLEATVILGS